MNEPDNVNDNLNVVQECLRFPQGFDDALDVDWTGQNLVDAEKKVFGY